MGSCVANQCAENLLRVVPRFVAPICLKISPDLGVGLVLGCLPLAAPIGLSPLLLLTLCRSERVSVVSAEPPDALSCLTTPLVGGGGDQPQIRFCVCGDRGTRGTGGLPHPGTPGECHARSAKFWMSANTRTLGVLPEPCAHRARTVRAPCVLLRILCPPDPQCLNLSCPGLSPDCLCTTTAPTGIGCRPLSLTLLQEVGVASLFGTNWVVKRSCTSMHPRSGWSLQL